MSDDLDNLINVDFGGKPGNSTKIVKKVQVSLDQSAIDVLSELQKADKSKDFGEVLTKSLELYNWARYQTANGHTVGSFKFDNTDSGYFTEVVGLHLFGHDPKTSHPKSVKAPKPAIYFQYVVAVLFLALITLSLLVRFR